MDVTEVCQCCLLRPPDKDLDTPYFRLDQTEIYSELLKECFGIHLVQSRNTCGICEVCIGRLQDAYDFKRQVQSCQTELQDRLMQAHKELSEKEESSDSEDEKHAKMDALRFVEVMVKVEPDTEKSVYGNPESAENPEGYPSPEQENKGPQKTLFCNICGQHFTSNTLFNEHVKIHEESHQASSPKVYFCDVCMKKFSNKSNLVPHMRIHTGDKPYSCQVCMKQFTNKRNMIYHSRSHTGEKPYACGVCMKQFSNKSILVTHMRTHADDTPYSCDICMKEFKMHSYLVTHMRRHTQKKRFSCEVCAKEFAQKYNLFLHRRIHTGEKPFSCEVCMKQFISKYSMLRHSRSHEQEC